MTEFFRTRKKFVELETKVLPDLLRKSPRLNIWSAGCSTGAEPYSLAIILNELTAGAKHGSLAWPDLDVEMLAKAKTGSYAMTELKNITPAGQKNILKLPVLMVLFATILNQGGISKTRIFCWISLKQGST